MSKTQGKKTGACDILKGKRIIYSAQDPNDSKTAQENVGQETNLKYYLAIVVSLLAFAVYLPALQNEFVNWDDNLNVYDNTHIRSLDTSFFKWAFFELSSVDYWRPLSWLSHALDYAVWGLNPLGHHLTNNVFHAINTFIVVLLVVKLMEIVSAVIPACPESIRCRGEAVPRPKRGRSAESPLQKNPSIAGLTNQISSSRDTTSILIAAVTTGLLFALHPLHVESVAWVSERKNLLCALFFLLSIMMYIRYITHPSLSYGKRERRNRGSYFLSLFFFTLALMGKPLAVSLPVVLLILDWYPLERIRSLKSFKSVLIEKLPFILLSLLSAIMAVMAQKTVGAMQSVEKMPLFSRVPIAFKSLIVYLWKMIFPLNLVPFYPYPKNASFLLPEYLLSAVLVIGITAACLLAVRRQKVWLSCWGYYFITLGPVLGIVQVGHQSMADRYTYLTDLGPFLLAGLAAAWFYSTIYATKKRGLINNIFSITAALLVISSMSYATIKQTSIWKNSINLWTYVIEKDPSTFDLAYNNRGSAFNDMGQYEKALEDFNKAIALNPSYALSYRNRGSAFNNMGRLDKALEDFDKAIALEPSAASYYLRGMVFDGEGLIDRAIKDYEHAVALNPLHGGAYFNLGVLYGKSGLIDKAIECFNKTIDIIPDHSLAYGNRGLAYFFSGQYEKALKDLDSAIELNRAYADAYANRGNVYIRMNNKELAVHDFQKACSLGHKEACNVMLGLYP